MVPHPYLRRVKLLIEMMHKGRDANHNRCCDMRCSVLIVLGALA